MTPLPWSGDMCTMHGKRLVGEMPHRADDAAMESWRSCWHPFLVSRQIQIIPPSHKLTFFSPHHPACLLLASV